MHMPSEIIDVVTAGAGFVMSAAAVSWAVKNLRKEGRENIVPLLSVMSAFVFAAQMVNFPVGPSSGHLVGSVLIASLLGAPAAIVGMAAVLTVQCLIFADGGLLALGLNIFNMGVVPVFIYLVVSAILDKTKLKNKKIISAIISSYIGIVVAATLVPFEISYSKVSIPFFLFLKLMAGVHALIGIGEAVITGGVLFVFTKTETGSLIQSTEKTEKKGVWPLAGVVLLMAIVIGAVFSNFASSMPDGLEMSLEKAKIHTLKHGKLKKSQLEQEENNNIALFPDYSIPDVKNEYLSTGIAGFVGTLIVFIIAFLIIKGILVKKERIQKE